jgi:anti-sigma regulatory factor (Ser/Thr protein kinase)
MTAIAAAMSTPLAAFTLPADPQSAAAARVHVRAALNRHGLADYCADAEVIASELVTNAITHAGPPACRLELVRLPGGAVAVIVADSSTRLPVQCDAAEFAEHGRGLRLVAALSARWGCTAHENGKSVYAVLARPA